MNNHNQDFVYVTNIRTTPDQLWEALTNPEFTKQYWFGIAVTSDWRVGSPVSHMKSGEAIVDGEVLAADPPKFLSYTFREVKGDASHEPASKVTISIEPRPGTDTVQLTIVHTGFVEDSKLRTKISRGWPNVLSGLKTLLETGKPLQF